MRLDNYNYNNKAPNSNGKRVSISPGYLIFFIVVLLVFIFVFVLFLGVRRNNKEPKETKVKEETTETEVVKYEGYAEQINSLFSEAYGYTYTLDVQPSENNAYFLDGIVKESVENKAYNISGTIVEKGMDGCISSEAMAEEDFAFTANGSYLDSLLFDYINGLPADDPRKDLGGYETNVDMGYEVSGTEIMKDIKETLISSEYKDEASSDSGFSVTYPDGALKADTGRRFFDKIINDYPGELKLTVRVENTENVTQIYITGTGEVSFELMMIELKTLGNYDSSFIDSAYNLKQNSEDPFYKKGKIISLDDYYKKYSK